MSIWRHKTFLQLSPVSCLASVHMPKAQILQEVSPLNSPNLMPQPNLLSVSYWWGPQAHWVHDWSSQCCQLRLFFVSLATVAYSFSLSLSRLVSLSWSLSRWVSGTSLSLYLSPHSLTRVLRVLSLLGDSPDVIGRPVSGLRSSTSLCCCHIYPLT